MSIFITGASGDNAFDINGEYVKTKELSDSEPVYQKTTKHMWIERTQGNYVVKSTGQRGKYQGHAHNNGGPLIFDKESSWKVLVNESWVAQPFCVLSEVMVNEARAEEEQKKARTEEQKKARAEEQKKTRAEEQKKARAEEQKKARTEEQKKARAEEQKKARAEEEQKKARAEEEQEKAQRAMEEEKRVKENEKAKEEKARAEEEEKKRTAEKYEIARQEEAKAAEAERMSKEDEELQAAISSTFTELTKWNATASSSSGEEHETQGNRANFLIDAAPYLSFIDKLPSVGAGEDVPLPQIAVVGAQSVGKSSLLERLTGVNACPLPCLIFLLPCSQFHTHKNTTTGTLSSR